MLSPASTALIDGMDFLNLQQANLQRNYLNRILDLIFCSLDQISIHESVAPLLPVDPHHPPLVVSLTVPANDLEFFDNNVEVDLRPLNYRKINFSALIEYLASLDFTALFDTMDVDDMATIFCQRISEWLSANVPRCKRPASPAWFTSQLRKLKRKYKACQRKLRFRRTPVTKQNFRQSSADYRRLNSLLYRSYVLRT